MKYLIVIKLILVIICRVITPINLEANIKMTQTQNPREIWLGEGDILSSGTMSSKHVLYNVS